VDGVPERAEHHRAGVNAMGQKRKKRNGTANREIATSAHKGPPRNDRKGGGAPEFEVRIRISKWPKVDHFSGDIEATNTTALIEALAVLIQKAAEIIGAPVEKVYSVVATVLFAEQDGMEDVEE